MTPDGRRILSAGEGGWRLWDAYSLQPIRKFFGHEGPIRVLACAGYSEIALSGGDATCRIWDLATGDKQAVLRDDAFSGAACLSPDGMFALTGTNRGGIKLWHAATGRLLRAMGQEGPKVTVLSMSHDGRFVVSGNNFGEFALWDLAEGKCARRFQSYESRAVSVSLSRDNRYVLAAVERGYPVMYRLASGRPLRTFTQGGTLATACLSPSGRFAVTAGQEGLFLWDVGMQEPLRVYEEGLGGVDSAALSPEGGFVATRGADHRLKLWMLDWELEVADPGPWDPKAEPFLTAFCTRRTPYSGKLPEELMPTDEEVTACLTRKGKAAWGEEDFELLLHELGAAGFGGIDREAVRKRFSQLSDSWTGPPEELFPLEPGLHPPEGGWTDHPGLWERFDAALEESKTLLGAGDETGALMALRRARGVEGFSGNAEALSRWASFQRAYPVAKLTSAYEAKGVVLPAFGAPVSCLGLDPVTRAALVGLAPQGPVQERLVSLGLVHGAKGPAWEVRRSAFHQEQAVIAMDMIPGGKALVADSEGRVILYNTAKDRVVRELPFFGTGIKDLRLCPRARMALIVDAKLGVVLMDVASGATMRSIPGQAAHPSPDWSRVFVANERNLGLWDMLLGKEILSMDRAGVTKVLRMSGDGSLGVTGSDRGKVKLWDLAQGSCLATWDGHKGAATALAIDPRGLVAFSGGRDGEIKAWDLQAKTEVAMETWHQGPVTSLLLTPENTHLVSTGLDHVIKVWALDWELSMAGLEEREAIAEPMLHSFVAMQTPYWTSLPKSREPSEEDVVRALTRKGRAQWGPKEFQVLLYRMQWAGLGAQDSDTVLTRLAGLVDEAGNGA
ncbi:MAG: WD40 repeat domain-containing protein [Desulfovibrio sp.]|nr:MAG: WD40 repeat domain-containing protein [Desulfovibrio sp.]